LASSIASDLQPQNPESRIQKQNPGRDSPQDLSQNPSNPEVIFAFCRLLNPHRSRHGGAIVATFSLYHFTLFNLFLTLRPPFQK
jgi:hypothetical protein